jgi:hypothetical protein
MFPLRLKKPVPAIIVIYKKGCTACHLDHITAVANKEGTKIQVFNIFFSNKKQYHDLNSVPTTNKNMEFVIEKLDLNHRKITKSDIWQNTTTRKKE